MDDLSQTLYQEIRHVAAAQLRHEKSLRSISPTDLAHEAIERAIRQEAGAGVTRAELLRRVSRLCRQVLVDRARSKNRLRRGEGVRPVRLEVDPAMTAGMGTLDLIAVDDALSRLGGLNERHASIVEMRFFGGLTMPEVATALDSSLSAVEKDWRKARAWLALALQGEERG